MANVKINQLPLATTPLTGTEVFPLVQGTTTKQVSITGLFTSPVMTNPTLGTVGQADLINATGLPISTGVSGLGSGIATFLGTPSSANLRAAVTDETGTGALVFATSPTLVTPDLGTPTAMVATNITGTALGLIAGSAVTNANLTGAVTSVGNATSLGSFTSAQLRTALTDETGSGVAVFATSPTLVTPDLGTPSAGVLTNATGLPLTTGVTGTLGLGNGGTGQTTANAAFNALAPSQTGNSGKYLTTDGTNTSWGTNPLGTVTSVDVSGGTTGLTTSGGPVTTSGTITIGGTLATTNGGTGLTSFTANGVLYASSTSALTSGSALTWNTTTFGVGGATVNTAGDNVDFDWLTLKSGVSAGNKKAIVWQDSGGTVLGRQYLTYTSPSASIVWGSLYNGGANNSDLMTLTPTGLGIGTSSPNAKLHVAANGRYGLFQPTTSTNAGYIGFSNDSFLSNRSLIGTDNSSGTGLWNTGGAAYALSIGTIDSLPIVFATNNTERMRLDTAGNLGLGVTPSAWFATSRILQIGSGGAIESRTNFNPYISTTSNAYLDTSGTYRYIGSAEAGRYLQDSGAHKFYTAPSGTAGNAISFTQAMTLTSGGDLLVGKTSSNTNVAGTEILGGSNAGILALTIAGRPLYINRLTTDGTLVEFAQDGTTEGSISVSGSTTSYNTSSDYRLKNITGPITTSGSYIDSLNPVEGTWKADGSTFVGLIAHEVQEASRTQVATGTKDGAEMQAMDYSNSELIANLIAEVKSLRQRVAQLETN